MRYFAFHVEEPEAPWVIAESPDETWARDLPNYLWHPAVVLSETEAELDPDFAPVLAAWRGGDDSAHEAWATLEDAEGALEDAEVELINEGVIDRPVSPQGIPAFLEAFGFDPQGDPKTECDRLFDLILGSCFGAKVAFGPDHALTLWRRAAQCLKNAAEASPSPRMV